MAFLDWHLLLFLLCDDSSAVNLTNVGIELPKLFRLQLLNIEFDIGTITTTRYDLPNTRKMFFWQFFNVLAKLSLLCDCHLAELARFWFGDFRRCCRLIHLILGNLFIDYWRIG